MTSITTPSTNINEVACSSGFSPKGLVVGPDFTPRSLSFGEVPCFSYAQTLKDELASGRLNKEDALFLYRQVLYIRAFETMIIRLRSGELVPHEGYVFAGTTHLSIGQEAVSVGANAALRTDDYITSTHRGHGHGIAKSAYALKTFSDNELQEFINGVSHFKSKKDSTLEQAIEVHLYRTLCEFMGKEDGYCRGRGGGMHIADFNVGHLGANAIVGGSLPTATGAGISMILQGKDRVVLCFFGDGACNNGVFNESLNMACMQQFSETGVPTIFLIENNQFGMSGRGVGEVTGIDYLARRGWSYNDVGMHAEVVNGMDVMAVYDAVLRAAETCRTNNGPVLLECMTYRYHGHSLSDQNAYREDEEIAAWRAVDPLLTTKQMLVDAGAATEAQLEAMEKDHFDQVEAITINAAKADFPNPAQVGEGLFSETTTDVLSEEFKTENYDAGAIKNWRDKKNRMPYSRALLEAMIEEMIRDHRVIMYGEDIAEYGGAFSVTTGLLDIFGRKRVFNTAISEATICGSAVGMAVTGLRPIVELMYIDFILMSMDQLGNQAAKNKYMFGGKAVIPMVCRASIGGGKGYAGQHSQSLEAITTQVPGLKVLAPSNAADAKGLLKAAIRDDNPVIFLEHQLLYGKRSEVPTGEHIVPIGKAAIQREGTDITLIGYSYMASIAHEAAEQLAELGISAEVVDPRTLVPLDTDTIIASVKKTHYALCLSQAPRTGCYSEHIIQQIQKHAFDYLDAPVELVAPIDIPPPMSPPLEAEFMPSPEKVVARVREMLNR
jgi:2-oxoisovalerate dehydrogenase E1 component